MMKLYDFNGPTFKKQALNEPPFAIAVTLPELFFKEYPGGKAEFEKEMKQIGSSDSQWWNLTISGIPRQDVGFCYIVYGGLVQYRLSILRFVRKETRTYHQEFKDKNWVELCAPVIKAPGEFLMRGFQGFRYTSEIF